MENMYRLHIHWHVNHNLSRFVNTWISCWATLDFDSELKCSILFHWGSFQSSYKCSTVSSEDLGTFLTPHLSSSKWSPVVFSLKSLIHLLMQSILDKWFSFWLSFASQNFGAKSKGQITTLENWKTTRCFFFYNNSKITLF